VKYGDLVSNKMSVMIVEDDPNFAAILRNTFDLSEEFEVVNVWNSIDAFGIAFLNATLKQDWLPDLIVADLLRTRAP
jgi:response regulator of citrate/malate metabolism